MKGVTANLAMDNFVTVMEYFQTLDRSDGEVEKGKQRYALGRYGV
jgi:hypothetical protein